MADRSVINEVVSKEAAKAFKDMLKDLDIGISKVEQFSQAVGTIKTPSETKKFIKEVNDELKRGNKITADAEAAQKRLEAQIKKQIALSGKLSKSEKEKAQAILKVNQIQRSNNQTEASNIRLSEQKNRAQERSIRNAKKEALQQEKINSAYNKLRSALLNAEKNYQNLAARLGTTSTETEKARQKVLRLRQAVDNINQPIKRFGDNVGNYPSALKGATKALRSFVSAFGLTSGIFLFVQVLRDAFTSVREFGKTMANISGILRTNRADIRDLEDVIISVAGSSVNTANQVAKLAESLLTLGQSRENVKKLLEPVNNLSLALGANADEAGEFLVQTLNAFGKTADSASEFADVIATIRTSTSLDFQRMRDAFQYITPISKILNKDLAYTGAIVGLLSDNGLKAESAGRLLATAQQRLAAQGKSLDSALGQINNKIASGATELEVLATASDLFGKQAGKIGVILAANTEELEKNSEKIRNNTGALDDLINEQLKSLDASLLILKSRFEEYILNQDDASRGSQKLSRFINFLSDNLSKILDTIIDVGQAFFIYKGIMLATSLATRAYTAITVGLRIAKVALSRGIKSAAIAMKGFNAATKANPLGLLLSVVSAGVATWLAFRDGVAETAEALREARKEADKTRQAIVESNIALVREQLKRIDEEITNEKKAVAEKIKTVQEEIKAREDGSKLLGEVAEEDAKKQEEIARKIQETKDKFNRETEEKEANRLAKIKQRVKEEEGLLGELAEAAIKADEVAANIPEADKVIGDLSGTTETINELQSILDELIKTQNKINKKPTGELDEQAIKDRFELERQRLQFQIEASKKILENEQLTLEERLLANNDYVDKSRELLRLETDFALSENKDRANKLIAINEAYEKEYTDLIESGSDQRNDIFKSEVQKRLETSEILASDFELRLQEQVIKLKQELLSQGKSTEEIERRTQEFVTEERRKALNKQLQFLEVELLAIATTADERIAIEEKIAALKERLLDQTLSKELSAEEKRREAIQQTVNLIGEFGNLFGALSEGRLQKIDEEIQRNDEYYNRLLENEQLTEDERTSLEAQREQKRKELDDKRIKEQQKQARFEKALALAQIAINTAEAISEASPNPLLIALAASIGAAQAATVLATPIPAYADGKKPTDGYTGLGYAGEVPGNTEVHTDKKGNIIGVYDKPTYIHTNAGDTIFKDIPSFKKYVLDNSLMGSIKLNSGFIPPLVKIELPKEQKSESDKLLRDIHSTLKRQKNTFIANVNVKNSFDPKVNRGNNV